MEVTYAYIAGLIDADGCLTLMKVDEGRYAPCLSFVNTSLDLIEFCQKHLNGKYYQKKSTGKNHADVYELFIRQNLDLIFACDKLIPYLRYKKEKAYLIKEYAVSIRDNKNKNRTSEMKEYRQDIVDRWKLL